MSMQDALQSPQKRDHDSFKELKGLEEPCSMPPYFLERIQADKYSDPEIQLKPPFNATTASPPSLLPSTTSASSALDGLVPPVAKRSRLSFEERELAIINKEIINREKIEAQARKQANKEIERRRKEEDYERKRAEKQAKEDDRIRKERSQLKLGKFFAISQSIRPLANALDSRSRTSTSPVPQNLGADARPAAPILSKLEQTPYEKLFPDFFVQSGVTLAPIGWPVSSADAMVQVRSNLDEYITEPATLALGLPGDIKDILGIPKCNSIARGKPYINVRKIMEDFYSGKSRPIEFTTDSQYQLKRVDKLLQMIPTKFLKFQEDVRPPYRGTFTSRPVSGMLKLARNPFRKDLPDTNYDYDSEAEWVEDEDGEDLKSGDEEEELDEDEDMDGFLDDEDDEAANSKRLILKGDLEPISTGLCWEDDKQRSPNVQMSAYRMEIILDPNLKSIDPFTTSYWTSNTSISMVPARVPLHTMKNKALNVTDQALTSTKAMKPFFPNTSSSSSSSPNQQLCPHPNPPGDRDAKPRKFLSPEDMPEFRSTVEGSDLSKIGLVEVLKKRFPGRPAAMIKATLEGVAHRVGKKEADKRWVWI